MARKPIAFALALGVAFGAGCGAQPHTPSADRAANAQKVTRLQVPRAVHTTLSGGRTVLKKTAASSAQGAKQRSVVERKVRVRSPEHVVYASRICAWWEGCLDESLHLLNVTSGRDRTLGIKGNVPRWSADGQRITYQRRFAGCAQAGGPPVICNDVFVAYADGTGERKVITPAANPVFTPDGKHLVLDRPVVCRTACFGISIVDLDGRNERVLTNSGSQPSVSPDGNWIVFVRDPEIWIMRSDGTMAHRLVAIATASFANRPEWSPDGRRIGFTAFLCTKDCSQRPDRYHTYVMNASGSRLRELRGVGGDSFSWSSDGRTVAVERANCWDSCPPPDTLLMSTAGTGTRLLVKSAASPAFMP